MNEQVEIELTRSPKTPPVIPRMHPFALSFIGEVEEEFRENYTRRSLWQLRLMLAAGYLLFALFGLYDMGLHPTIWPYLLWLRFLWTFPVVLAVFLLTWTGLYRRRMQPLITGGALAIGLAIIAMHSHVLRFGDKTQNSHFLGFLIFLLIIYTLLRLRFIYAAAAGWFLAIVYQIGPLRLMDHGFSANFNESILLVAVNLIGMFGTYSIERTERIAFLRGRQLRREQEKILSANRELEDEVRNRSLLLRQANDNLEQLKAVQQEVEKSLFHSETRRQTLIESMNEGVGLVDIDERFIFTNPAAEKIFGVEPGGLVGVCLLDFLDEDDRVLVERQTRLRLSGHTSSYDIRIRRPDGERREVMVTASPLFDRDGATRQILGVFQDVTEMKKAQQDKARLQAQLAHSEKMEAIGRLAGGLAHDFNNLLTAVKGYTHLLSRKLGEEHPGHWELREIDKTADRAGTLTQQLLAFSRKQAISPKLIDLNEQLEAAKDMLKRLIGEDLELIIRRQEKPATIFVDPGQLDRVLVNLCVNARDAMPRGGRLQIVTGEATLDGQMAELNGELTPGDYITLAVIDDGIGMDEKTRQRIFEPFFTTKAEGKGTGLGLATVYGIIKQSKGHICCRSTPNQGTAFTMYLPKAIGEKSPEVVTQTAAPVRGKETILLVEDEELVRALASKALSLHGYQVHVADSGPTALREYRRLADSVDLILTDVVMPKMDGREMTDRMREIDPRLKVLFMSGYSPEIVSRYGVVVEQMDFLAKPFTIDELLGKVRYVLDRRNLPA